jgi:hypothetical protein
MKRIKSWIPILTLAALGMVLAAGTALAQGTITGAPPVAATNSFTVSVTIPQRVGVAWDRNVVFDLGTANSGSCGSYPPAPATSFPCYWDDNNGTAMSVQLFANAAGGGSTVRASVQGAAGNFGTSNATIANVLYADGGTATCAAGTAPGACAGYTQMSSGAATSFASVGAPTTGWGTYPNGRKFVFEVTNNLTTTTAASNQATFTVTLP